MKKLTIYNNVRERRGSPRVSVFNQIDTNGEPTLRKGDRVVIDCALDANVLAFAILCRDAGVRTLGTVESSDTLWGSREEDTVFTHSSRIALFDWVCPRFWWREGTIDEHANECGAVVYAVGRLASVLRPFKIVPVLSIESMHPGSEALPLRDEELRNQASCVSFVDRKLLGGVLVSSGLSRWKELYDLYLRGDLKKDNAAWAEMREGERRMSLRGINTTPRYFERSFNAFLDREIKRVRSALAEFEL